MSLEILPKRFRDFREKAGLTQKQLADLIGKSHVTVQSYEKGTSFPNADTVWKMCEIYKTDPDDLLGWYIDHPTSKSQPAEPDEHELLEDYRACSGQWKDQVLMSARAAAVTSGSFSEPAVPSAQEA